MTADVSCGTWDLIKLPFLIAGLGSVLSYLLVIVLQNLVFDLVPVNLKKKYKASWAIVTGASSGYLSVRHLRCSMLAINDQYLLMIGLSFFAGIGRGIVEKLIEQEINVVLVALNDSVFDEFYAEITQKHKNLKVRMHAPLILYAWLACIFRPR